MGNCLGLGKQKPEQVIHYPDFRDPSIPYFDTTLSEIENTDGESEYMYDSDCLYSDEYDEDCEEYNEYDEVEVDSDNELDQDYQAITVENSNRKNTIYENVNVDKNNIDNESEHYNPFYMYDSCDDLSQKN